MSLSVESQPPVPPAGAPSDTPLEAEWTRILTEAGLTEQAGLPPTVLSTPNEIRVRPGEEIEWWQPGWNDVVRHVGWRWVFLLPSLALLALGAWFWRWPNLGIWVAEAQLLLFTGAIALTLAGYIIRRAARSRHEPFCIFCGYNLSGLPDHYRCPECGRPYTWRLIAEYRRDPQWFVERYRALRRLPPPAPVFEAGSIRRRRSRDGT
ncbi:MAG: hypothetical protein HRF50_00185 [Phycisphaerae bacterium]|jgi:predicted RNA-binding Zn-ribbon protein involved in translation (DUF1610 family)